MSQIDYKSKYMDLKAKFMSTVDLSWRLGYEEGLKAAQLDQAQQTLQTAAEQSMPGEEGANPEQSPSPEEGANPADGNSEQPQDSIPGEDELGKHIEKLESMLGKGELSSLDATDLKKTLNDIRSLQTSINLMKSMESAKKVKMGKNKSVLKMTPKLHANLKPQAKEALSLQKKIVDDVFSKWNNDINKVNNDILSTLKINDLTKKE